ncbi:methionyl-tRNA formyltransferase [Sulfurihydrogenibium yellowstonense]|uniref:Methionyl-tRNA formyltransferase n=1 Tax=Sulfurihydrogenibium yellowstonense SS-5 TaxID=432331 RepID=C4FJV1_9AQUI|nr:methionyl-tRNA formyltransferase [Sulfurihydrogenibium yellowstonense]EEP60643.1 methionyl-tRNA formyltransferase [Sulfurihydrogenibium yellowstonense SS-5]
MRVLFWGTPDFAVKSLKALIESNHQVVGVVTQPDKPRGRGQKIQPTPVKEEALKYNIPVFQPEKIKNNQEFLETVKKLNPDISVVVAYGKILPEEIINIPKYKTINVHASLLPEYRGAAPIQRAIMEGKDKTGVCIMEIIKELDAGDVYACREVEITEDDDIISLHDKLAGEGARLLIEVLDKIEKGEIDKKPQNHEKATYAKPIEKSEGKIDFSRSAKEIFNQIRALKVWPKAYAKFRDEEVKILDAKIVECNVNALPGEIIKADEKEGIVVKAGNGCLLLKLIQFPNSKPITTQDAIRGYKIKVGERFE